MDDSLLAAYNDQIALEYASSYAYRQMSAWASSRDLTGTATWLESQADEEMEHAHKLIDFVLDRDGEVVLQAIAAPTHAFPSVVALFEAALAHEQRVSASIADLYSKATEVGDLQSLPLLQWFLGEQVEEEASVRTILGELRMVGDDGSALLLLDRELGDRRGHDAPGA